MKKYIFVTGGVCSSLGKGIAAASLGTLLECRGLNIRMIKIDPYINVDAGTMSPYQHGEVFVTDDGAETDLDLGNYERFTNSPLSQANSITTGQIYQSVIQKEREGRYLGKTVQVIPHITDEIKNRIVAIGSEEGVDAVITEIGGTVGDIESIPFLEAARQFVHDFGRKNVLFVHLTLVPIVIGGELKTKPTQHSVKELREIGIQPDILLCRAPHMLESGMRDKIALFTNVDEEAVITAYDVKSTIYEIPLVYHQQYLDQVVVDRLSMETGDADLTPWREVVDIYHSTEEQVNIGIVGKYVNLNDTYKSIHEALHHGGIANKVGVNILYIDSEKFSDEESLKAAFNNIHGILIPGGFGQRGIEGMIMTAGYARRNNIPYFGICLGLQVMIIEYARSVMGLEDANSTEFSSDCEAPVVSLLEEQVDIKDYGGTMRLGRTETVLKKGTKLHACYERESIYERHRHRYEVSNNYRNELEAHGLVLSGLTPDKQLVESVEWTGHSWGVGVQFHPEFRSKPTKPHPIFAKFIEASIENTR
jgi:CTP synthase